MEDSAKNKVLEIEDKAKIQRILGAFESNYEMMAEYLEIVQGNIKIRNPFAESGH